MNNRWMKEIANSCTLLEFWCNNSHERASVLVFGVVDRITIDNIRFTINHKLLHNKEDASMEYVIDYELASLGVPHRFVDVHHFRL